ncbi:MAG: hypothetical protein AAGA85_06110 [Bacteroidota bacterium]
MRTPIVAFLISFMVSSCNPLFEEVDETAIWSNVESVETLFVSHQGDTQEKHNRIVATAQFLPDGTVEKITQHMTYPYTNRDPSDRELWAVPEGDLWLHTLDGLGLGHAEKNFCYGNDWPVVYARWVEDKGHPRFKYHNSEMSPTAHSAVRYAGALPTQIRTILEWKWDRAALLEGFQEEFEYDDQKVTVVSKGDILNEALMADWEQRMEEKRWSKRPSHPSRQKPDIHFVYEGNDLTYVKDGVVTHKFGYDDAGRLATSEYFLRGERMTLRVYHYGDNGLKTKTDIFNRLDELEYSILYNYTFYSES